MSKRPKLALWFRYGPAAHSELFHAIPSLVERLSAHAEVHYYGMRTAADLPALIKLHAVVHELPFHVDRHSSRDKLFKTSLWLLALPWVGLHCRLTGIKAVYIDETIPFSALIARISFGRNVAITVADFFVDIYFRGWLAWLGCLIKRLDVWSWKGLPLVFTRAHNTRDWLVGKGLHAERIAPVYDPCDFSIYHPLGTQERLAARQALGYGADDIVLVHHGILHPNKGNDKIIRAISDLRDTHSRLRYLLIGDGVEMANLRRLVEELGLQDRCQLTGWLPTLQDVNRTLNAGDIGLVMRIGEQSDNFHMTGALVHNMACGLPLLAARLGGVCEVVKDGHNGLLFDPHDMETFKEQLIRLADSPQDRASYGSAALRDANIHFDMARVVDNTAAPLLHLMQGGR
jgi:glycosyltransferase involved in cell wall biosynthesis